MEVFLYVLAVLVTAILVGIPTGMESRHRLVRLVRRRDVRSNLPTTISQEIKLAVVAHLVERFVANEEAEGSKPFYRTKVIPSRIRARPQAVKSAST